MRGMLLFIIVLVGVIAAYIVVVESSYHDAMRYEEQVAEINLISGWQEGATFVASGFNEYLQGLNERDTARCLRVLQVINDTLTFYNMKLDSIREANDGFLLPERPTGWLYSD